jgi:hypothetical protein
MAKKRKSRDDERRADAIREPDASTRGDERESGAPGGGAGRRDDVGRTGVYPQSASERPAADAPTRTENSWGQGERGAAGYEDSGTSELASSEEIRRRVERDRQSAASGTDEAQRSGDEQRSSDAEPSEDAERAKGDQRSSGGQRSRENRSR